jgi:hypothetical protein
MLSSFDDYWKYCRLCISPIPFLLFLCFLFSASSLKASFFSCFNSYYLLSRIKFGIRVRVLIFFIIKRSICLRLTLDWYKKKSVLFWLQKKTVHLLHQQTAAVILNKSGKRRLQRVSTPIGNSASTLVTPRPMAVDSLTEVHSPRLRQIAPNHLQQSLHRTTADLRLQLPSPSTISNRQSSRTGRRTKPITANVDSWFTGAKAAPEPVPSSSAPAIELQPPLNRTL